MLQEEVPQRSIKRVLDVGCCKITKTVKKVVDRTLLHPPPPPKPEPPPNPPPPPHPPTNVPTNGSADKHEKLPKVARTSVETSAKDHTRCSEVTMIWKETRTRRGLRRPAEPKKKGKRTLINLSETFGGSGNPRAGGSYDICNAEVGMKICNAEGLQGTAQGSITGPILARPNWQK